MVPSMRGGAVGLAALLVSVGGTLSAQSAEMRWRVDAGVPRPGCFATVADAVAAAASGDTIVLAPGIHAMPGLVTKGVRIVGEAGAVLDPTQVALRIVGLGVNERFVLANVTLLGPGVPRFELDANHGAIHFVAVRAGSDAPAFARTTGIWIRDCSWVTLDGCAWGGAPAILATRSRVRITGGVWSGLTSPQGHAVGHALRADAADIELIDAQLTGAAQLYSIAAMSAIDVLGGQLLLSGADLVVTGGTTSLNQLAAAVTADPAALVRVARGAQLNPNSAWTNPIVGTTPVALPEIATASAWSTADALLVGVGGAPGTGALVIGGLLTRPQPSIAGLVHVDPFAAIPLGATVLDARGRGVVRRSLPTDVAVGAAIAVQSIVIHANGLEAGTPSIAVFGR